MHIKSNFPNAEFTIGTDVTTLECLAGSSLLEPLGNIEHVENTDFVSFFVEYLLPDEEVAPSTMDQVLPVIAHCEFGDAPVFSSSVINWVNHALPYLVAFSWLAKVFAHSGPETTIKRFHQMTVEQKTIIQRGFEIMYFDAFPPLTDGRRYRINMEIVECTEATVFPVRRIEGEINPTFDWSYATDFRPRQFFH